MKSNRIYAFISLFLMALYLLGCGRPSDEDLIEAASLYKEGNAETEKKLADMFMQRIEKDKFDKKYISLADSVLFIERDSDIEIIYPIKKSFSIAGSTELLNIAAYGNVISYTDGTSIYLAGFESDPAYSAKENNSIKSVLVYEDDIYFYEAFKLKKVSITSRKDSLVVNDNFFPPYKKLFGVTLKRHGSLMGVSAGIAGSYYISIVDLSSSKVKISNIRSASSTFDFDDRKVYFLGGATANWEIIQIDMATKNKKSLYRISNIGNLVVHSKGYVYENNEGLFVSDYSKKPIKLPFNYKLIGNCNNMIVLRFKSIFTTDLDDLYKSGIVVEKFFN